DLLLSDVSSEEWDRLIRQENILRKRTGNTAMTYASLARARLQTMTPELWELVRDGSMPVASQAVLAATLKFSPLFGNFLRTTLRDEFRRFSVTLEPRLWELVPQRSEEHTSELQSRENLVCRLLLEKKKNALHPPVLASALMSPSDLDSRMTCS